jgi:hypothetical protein
MVVEISYYNAKDSYVGKIFYTLGRYPVKFKIKVVRVIYIVGTYLHNIPTYLL